VLSIAVEPHDGICPESACDAEDGCELKPGEETHDGPGAGVCRGVLRVIQVRADLAYYYERNRWTGDFHGQAPVMWAAGALLRDGE
jgi:hypothetical protein